MERKWEWIANRLRELGYTELAEMAEEIDRELTELYGSKSPKDWASEYPTISAIYKMHRNHYLKLDHIKNVARNPRYCIACNIDQRCGDCAFAMVAGKCESKDSKYGRFYIQLSELIKRLTTTISTLQAASGQ